MMKPAMKIADAEVEAPRPGAAAVDDVLFAEPRVLGAEEARPRDHPPDDEVDEAAEARSRRRAVRRIDLPDAVVRLRAGTRSRPPGSSGPR